MYHSLGMNARLKIKKNEKKKNTQRQTRFPSCGTHTSIHSFLLLFFIDFIKGVLGQIHILPC